MNEIILLEIKYTGEILGFVVLRGKNQDFPIDQIIDILTPRTKDGTIGRALSSEAIN